MIQIEKMLVENNWGKLLDDDYINSLDKNADYSFLEKYAVYEKDKRVRNLTLTFCQMLMPANAFKVFAAGLKDKNDQNVNRAAWGIYELSPVDNKDDIIKETKILTAKYRESIKPAFVKLVLTIGNVGNVEDLKKISDLISLLNNEEINEAILWASAKVGDLLAIEKVIAFLTVGTLREKVRILEGVEYINKSMLVKDVNKLLADERVVETQYRGESDRILYQLRLCDKAISTLLKIDKKNNIIELIDLDAYSDNDLAKVRKYYSDYIEH